MFWYGFGGLCARTEAKLYYFRPSELLSPKRKLQNLVPGFGSSISLRRSLLGLSERFSRSGENGSPKRGRDGTCAC